MKFLFLLLAALSAFSQAATIEIAEPPGIYAEAVITSTGGTVRWNTQAISIGSPYVLEGQCVRDYITVGIHGQQINVGFTCIGSGKVHITTTGQLTTTCPYDGGMLQGLRLTLTENGALFYDKELWPNPIVCYLTPASPAVVTWNAPYVTFDNALSARASSAAGITVESPAWLFSQHIFLIPEGITCSALLRNIGTRWKPKRVETGFICNGVVAPFGVATVLVQ
jgi:hypothetical protein